MADSPSRERKPVRSELTHEQDTHLVQPAPLSEGQAQQIQKRIDSLEQRIASESQGARRSNT